MRSPTLALLFLSLLGTSCAIHVDGDHWNDMDRAIDRAAAEVNLHYAYLNDAATIADARAEVARHVQVMRARLADVRVRLEDSGCFDSAGSMHGMVESAAERLEDYVDETAGSYDLAALRDACERYGDDMDHLIGRMMSRQNVMWCP